jgi:hypothetical protein
MQDNYVHNDTEDMIYVEFLDSSHGDIALPPGAELYLPAELGAIEVLAADGEITEEELKPFDLADIEFEID